jgi:chromosome segregation ATPase
MQVERELLPLQARLVKLESTRGVSHPEAEAVRHRIEQCLDQLRRLNGRIARERRELAGRAIAGERSEPVAARQAERASALMQALAAGLKERRRANEQELRRLNRQIALEKHAADELETFEARDAAYRRRIAGLQGMLSQVEQQLAGLDPASLGGAIAVAPLQTRARTIPTGSELSADLMRYGVLGLALGCGLMLLV